MKRTLLILLATILCIAGFTSYKQRERVNNISDKIIRFHVIANSDSEEDQNVKLEIRDELLGEHGEELSKLKSREESIQYLNTNLKEIEAKANSILKRENKNYTALAVLGKSQFPIKQYGDLTLPAGEYTSLRIVLGEGGGKNWWCVMFPPLCFIDITHARTSKESSDQLKKVINEEENKSITAFKQQTTKVEAASKDTKAQKNKESLKAQSVINKKENNKKTNKLAPTVQFKFKSIEVLKRTFEKFLGAF